MTARTTQKRFPTESHKGLKPEWANLPRRFCDDCGEKYKPMRPVLEGQRGFCCANCRKSYHKHGGAYRKLKVELEKMVAKRLPELVAQEVEKRMQFVWTWLNLVAGNHSPHVHMYKGTGGPCTICGGGIYLERLAHEIQAEIRRTA